MTNFLPNLQIDFKEYKDQWFQGTAENGLKVEVKGCQKYVIAGYNLPVEIVAELANLLPAFDLRMNGKIVWCRYETLVEAEQLLQEVIDAFDLVDYEVEVRTPKQTGVTFEGTNFENYGERDFMAAVTQITKQGFKQYLPTGRNLVHEYVAAADSRIDAVELDENGNVTTVIECQSGIQNGEYLDAVHFEKSISRYPHLTGAKRVVIIAGGYTEAQLETFAQLPFEVITLTTTVVDGQIELI